MRKIKIPILSKTDPLKKIDIYFFFTLTNYLTIIYVL